MEEKKENKDNRKSSIIKCIIIIALFIAIGAGGIFVGMKLSTPKEKCDVEVGIEEKESTTKLENKNTSNTKNDADENTQKSTISINSSIAKRLYKMVYDRDESQSGDLEWIYPDKNVLATEMTEEQKMALVYQNIAKIDFTAKGDDGQETKPVNGKNWKKDKSKDYISIETVKEAYEIIFGTLETFNQDTVMYVDKLKGKGYIYDNKTKYYNYYTKEAAVPGDAIGLSEKQMTSITYNGNDIIIEEKETITDFISNKKTTKTFIYTFKKNSSTNDYYFYSRSIKNK